MTDKPMSMVERVARAIFTHGRPSHYADWEANARIDGNLEWELARARAAIAVMRDPTEAMEISAMKKLLASDFVANQARYNRGTWQAYIDTALSEPQGTNTNASS